MSAREQLTRLRRGMTIRELGDSEVGISHKLRGKPLTCAHLSPHVFSTVYEAVLAKESASLRARLRNGFGK
jgi:hypothetical protein